MCDRDGIWTALRSWTSSIPRRSRLVVLGDFSTERLQLHSHVGHRILTGGWQTAPLTERYFLGVFKGRGYRDSLRRIVISLLRLRRAPAHGQPRSSTSIAEAACFETRVAKESSEEGRLECVPRSRSRYVRSRTMCKQKGQEG